MSSWALLAMHDKASVAARTLPDVLLALQRCLAAHGKGEGMALRYARSAIILELPKLRDAQAVSDAVAATADLPWDVVCVCSALRLLHRMCVALLELCSLAGHTPDLAKQLACAQP